MMMKTGTVRKPNRVTRPRRARYDEGTDVTLPRLQRIESERSRYGDRDPRKQVRAG